MIDFLNNTPLLKYLILLLAVGAGYMLFSKILDAVFPPKNSPNRSEPSPPFPPTPATKVEDVETLRKQQDLAYKEWQKDREK